MEILFQLSLNKLDIYFLLCVLDNTFAHAVFTVTLLSGSAYKWYTTQHYAIKTGNANRLTWEHLKSDLGLYFKPPDYTYQIQVALLYCKQSEEVVSYICMFLQHLNRYLDVEEIEAIFYFVEVLVPEVKCYVWL